MEESTTRLITIAPKGATFAEEDGLVAVNKGSFLTRLEQALKPNHIMLVNTRELQLIVEYRDVLDIEVRALIGLRVPDGYNSVWGNYVSTMDRITLDLLKSEMQEANDRHADTGQNIHTTPEIRRVRFESISDDDNFDGPAAETT